MDRTPVQSSQIVSIGYDETNQVLEVEFKRSAAVYHYVGVSRVEYLLLIRAESIGQYFNRNIKGKYQFHKLGGDHAEASKAQDSSKEAEASKEAPTDTTAADVSTGGEQAS